MGETPSGSEASLDGIVASGKWAWLCHFYIAGFCVTEST